MMMNDTWKNSLRRVCSWLGRDELLGGVQSPFSLSLSDLDLLFFVLSLCLSDFDLPFLLWWLVLFIEALVLFPNIEQEGSQQWRANLKGDS